MTQFQGAFSDDVVKNLVILLALFGTSRTAVEKNRFGESIGALFSLPFILFPMAGGFLADRLSKRTVMLGGKVFGCSSCRWCSPRCEDDGAEEFNCKRICLKWFAKDYINFRGLVLDLCLSVQSVSKP